MNALLNEKLEHVEWGEYKLGDLFDSFNGDFDIQKGHINGLGNYVITAGLTENGILGKTDIEARIFDEKTITIDMFGFAFYRPFKYKIVTHARVFSLKPKFEITDKQGLFLANSLHFLNKKFGYQNMCSWTKIQNEKIQLPTKNGEIDFEFIESFIAELEAERLAELEAERLAELEAYLTTTGLKDYTLTNKEKRVLEEFESGKVEWSECKIGELFDIATGRDVIIGKVLDGEIPLISHQHENNGITKKITQLSNRRLFNFKNTLPLADRGVFLATTQNENFHIGTRVKALTFKDGEKDIKSRLFFVSSINKLQILFTDYSNNATGNLPNYEISLPIQNNQPNYEIMETFISAIQKLVIKDVVLYADSKIEATRKVVEKKV